MRAFEVTIQRGKLKRKIVVDDVPPYPGIGDGISIIGQRGQWKVSHLREVDGKIMRKRAVLEQGLGNLQTSQGH